MDVSKVIHAEAFAQRSVSDKNNDKAVQPEKEAEQSSRNMLSKNEKTLTEAQIEQFKEEQKRAEEQGKSMLDYGKLLRIAARIMNGDKVPETDKKKLAEAMPDLYRQAEMMKRTDNLKPKKYDSLFDDEEEPSEELMKDTPENEATNAISDITTEITE